MPQPRLTTVMGVARVVLTTVGPATAAEVLVDEFGFDASLQALAVLPGDPARAAFGEVWTRLALDPLDSQLRRGRPLDGTVDDEDHRSGRVHG